MKVGDIVSWQRTFTEEDVRIFGKISGDEGIHHTSADELGRIMVQGLLTATLPTKIGGDMNFIAREMNFQFIRPVYVGDTVKCEVKLTEFKNENNVIKVASEWVCTNQQGKVVLSGNASGIVRTNAQ